MNRRSLMNRSLGLQLEDDLSFTLLDLGEVAHTLATGRAALQGAQNLPSTPQALSCWVDELVQTDLGWSQRLIACVDFGPLRQELTIDQYADWPDSFVLQWVFENRGDAPLRAQGMLAPRLQVMSLQLGEDLEGELWTLQGPAVKWGQDFAFPLPAGFHRDNFLGHNDNGEGGGIPVLYAWSQQLGLALAHVEPQQAHWYMPVTRDEQGVWMALEDRRPLEIAPGQRLHSLRVLISRHRGDFFAPLSLYRQVMARQGLAAPPANLQDFQPAWCSWGYEFDVRPEEMLGVLPALQDLGIRWLTLDDRWFDRYGDWNPRPDTFPGGQEQVRQMVAGIHRAGAYAQIWWYPLCVEDGVGGWEGQAYGVSALLSEQGKDWLLLHQDGSPARNNRGLAILCPALPAVQAYTQALVQRFIQDWGFDGHKLDNIYTVPACYNPRHHHRQPEDSLLGFAEVYRLIFETTRQIKPDSVTQICPCGTPITHMLIPYTDQTVTADPTSSLQIRQRIKFYKALMGANAAVFADHVELSDGSSDFASEIGAGGVPATKFIWPDDGALRSRLSEWWALTPQKREHWKMWLEINARHRLSEGEYLNLYDLAFDLPEAHAIRKDGALYYAFYTSAADQTYRGEIALRGLDDRPYRIRDYVRARSLGTVHGPVASLQVEFLGSLLLQAVPKKETG